MGDDKKKMTGDRGEWNYLVLVDGSETAVTNKEQVEMMAITFVKMNSYSNLSDNVNVNVT